MEPGRCRYGLLLGEDGAPSLSIRGLKDRGGAAAAAGKKPDHNPDDSDPDDERPYDAFGGLSLLPARYTLAPTDEYHSRWVDDARSLPEWRTGGYSVDEFLGRAMHEAFCGLGVFVADDKDAEEVRKKGVVAARAEGAVP